jgi:hypothetical protein
MGKAQRTRQVESSLLLLEPLPNRLLQLLRTASDHFLVLIHHRSGHLLHLNSHLFLFGCGLLPVLPPMPPSESKKAQQDQCAQAPAQAFGE